MIKHVVMWKFREKTEKEQKTFFAMLRRLYGTVPQLKGCEIRQNITPSKENCDAIIIGEFEDVAALEEYLVDPRHRAVAAVCKPICVSRVALDFDC
mgnify:FL=1